MPSEKPAMGTRFLFIALFLTAYLPRAYAWPPTFGPEFTFTNQKIIGAWSKQKNRNTINNDENEAARDAWGKRMSEICKARGDCEVIDLKDKFGLIARRVTYKDGWWYQVTVDPAVVEVQAKAANSAQYLAMERRIQSDIFDVAASLDMWPHSKIGAGHIHIGYSSAFQDDLPLFRNFMVDYANHPELGGSGIFEDDRWNAPSLLQLSPKAIRNFKTLIQNIDNGRITEPKELARKLQKKVYFDSPFSHASPSYKYQAFNVSRVSNLGPTHPESTIELRPFPAQKNAQTFIQEIRLIESRLTYLKGLQARVPFRAPLVSQEPQAMVDQFYQYVTESGLKWEDYRNLLPEDWKRIVPNPPQVLGAEDPVDQARPKPSWNACLKRIYARFFP